MFFRRTFAIAAAVGLIMGAALIGCAEMRVSAGVITPGTGPQNSAAGDSTFTNPDPERPKIVEGSSEIQAAQAEAEQAYRAAVQNQLAEVRAATLAFHETDVAKAAGYVPAKGLDNCFDNPGVGGMGFHLINASSLDLTLDPLKPEAMVYTPGPIGQLLLGSVEYIVPADAWRTAGHLQPPSLLGQSLHLNSALGIYILHAWIWEDNPSGIFEDWNPTVSCTFASAPS